MGVVGGYYYDAYYYGYYFYDDDEAGSVEAVDDDGVLPPPKPALKSIEETKPASKVKPAPKVHGHKRRLGSDNDGGYGAYVLSSSTF